MLVRRCEWSLQLWQDVWTSRQYDDKPFYEQSALVKCLRSRNEGLSLFHPFHTFLPGATQGVKILPHVAVLPHTELNTNIGWYNLSEDRRKIIVEEYRRYIPKRSSKRLNPSKTVHHSAGESSTDVCSTSEPILCINDKMHINEMSKSLEDDSVVSYEDNHGPVASFVFHPAGMGKKVAAMAYMLDRCNIPYQFSLPDPSS